MASAQHEVPTKPQNRKWIKAGITSVGFVAAVATAFYLGSQHSASPPGNALQSAAPNAAPSPVPGGSNASAAPANRAAAPAAVGSAGDITLNDPDPKGSQWVIDTDNEFHSNYPADRHSTQVVLGYGLMYKPDADLPLEEGMGGNALSHLIDACKTSTSDSDYAMSREYENTLERIIQDNDINGFRDPANPVQKGINDTYRNAAWYAYRRSMSNSDYRVVEDVAKQELDAAMGNAGVGDCLDK